jgi:hypothetical protein
LILFLQCDIIFFICNLIASLSILIRPFLQYRYKTCVILSIIIGSLKGQRQDIFCIWFFLWIIFPQASDNCIRVISNIFENSLTNIVCVVATGGKFATSVNDTSGKYWEQYQTAETLKGPKLEIFGSWVFTQVRPGWVGDLETRPKNSILGWFRPEIAKLNFLAL